MRIAMISTPFLAVPPRDYGGTELVVHELVEGLVGHGHDVTLFATGDSTTSAELRSIYPAGQWPPAMLPELNHVSWAMREIAEGEYDVVHLHCAAGLAFGRLVPELPLVYTLHHVRTEEYSRYYPYFPEVHYVAISADQARREVALPHVTVIHHGLDPSRFEWTETPGEYVVFIGRFAEVKGPHTAIDAAAAAGLPIRVAGETHSVDGAFGRREVESRLTEPHVTYLGKIGMRKKRPLLRDARALLSPITWNEPFGLILAEAMLSGCPVVAFGHGSVPELVEEGVTGFVPKDAAELVEVIRPGGPLDHFDRRRCRERAVERFGRERLVADHERLYQSIRRGGARARALAGAA